MSTKMAKITIRNLRVLKMNLLKLVGRHRDDCCSEYCTISLQQIKTLAEYAGVTFTKKEAKVFL